METHILDAVIFPGEIILTVEYDTLQNLENNNTIAPQTHFSLSYINSSYFAEQNGFTISTNKIIKEVIRIQSRESIFEEKKYSKLKIKLINSFDFSSIGTLDMDVTVVNKKVNFNITGTLSIGSNNFKGHLYSYAGIYRGINGLGSRINLKTMEPDNNFENSILFSLIRNDNDFRCSSVDTNITIDNYSILKNLIGRGVALERSQNSELLYIGDILPRQPESCTKNNEECIGFDLEDHLGYCIFLVEGRSFGMRMEFTITPNNVTDTILISGVISKQLYIRYFSDSSLFISLGYDMKTVTITSFQTPDYYRIDDQEIAISPKNLLGNLLHLHYQALGGVTRISTCTVALEHPGLRYQEEAFIEYRNAHSKVPKAEPITLAQYIIYGFCFLMILIIVLALFRKSLKSIKQKSLAKVIDNRKESFQHTETARTITMTRNATLVTTTLVTTVDKNEKTENTERRSKTLSKSPAKSAVKLMQPIDAILEENEKEGVSAIMGKDKKDLEGIEDLEAVHGDFQIKIYRGGVLPIDSIQNLNFCSLFFPTYLIPLRYKRRIVSSSINQK